MYILHNIKVANYYIFQLINAYNIEITIKIKNILTIRNINYFFKLLIHKKNIYMYIYLQ